MNQSPRPLGPLAPHGGWLAAAALAVGWNASSGPHVFDAGELVQAGFLLGGSHPPGQPVHALVAQAASLLPFGPVPWRMALVSAASAVIAAWLAGRVAGFVLERLEVPRSLPVRLAPDAVALGVLLSPPVLRQAGRVEVYGIALSLSLLALLTLLRWAARTEGSARSLRIAAVAAGLAVGVHPPHAAAVLAIGFLLLLTQRRDVLRRPAALGWAALACIVALAGTHAYLPIRASAGAPMWGDPTTWAGLWDYVSAHAYRSNLGATQGGLSQHVLGGATYVALASGLVPLVGAALLARRARENRTAAAALIATAASLIAAGVIAIDDDIPDAVAYAGLPVAALVAAGGAGLASLFATAAQPAARALGAALLLGLGVNLPGLARAPEAIAQDAAVLETVGGALVDTPPPRSLVVIEGDFEAATWMMAQAVDGARPDAALFITGLATSSWHWKWLRAHPLYDGSPIRGRGRDARAAYVDGAVRHAAGKVPVAAGPVLIYGAGSVAGPYRILWTRPDPPVGAIWERSMGERLAPTIAREATAGAAGDHEVVAAVVRHQQVAHARRLFARGEAEGAFEELRRAMAPLPRQERALVGGVATVDPVPPGALPRAVEEPHVFLMSADDTLRVAATLLWTAGRPEPAHRLLALQLDRGDPLAALQLGWLRLASGDAAGALEAAEAVSARNPELHTQARELAAAARPAPERPAEQVR